MNKPQRNIVFTGLMVIAMMALIPPQARGDTGGSFGYGFLFDTAAFTYYGAKVDLPRLLTQILLVAAVCAALYLYFKQDS